jgi:hypothetical protein
MTDCPDCGAKPGEIHKLVGCDVERCPLCGLQAIGCGCDWPRDVKRLPWTGEWPGKAECREWGWYAVMVEGRGYVPCDRDSPGATEDLNRIYAECRWDAEAQKWVRPE